MTSEHIRWLQEAEALLDPAVDRTANMANLCALLMERMQEHWIGFYRVQGEELILGPFQGPVACTRIAFGKGVCGTAWLQKKTIIVEDVHAFPGHIACSPYSNSEIVVPCMDEGEVFAVLDIDSTRFDAFGEAEQEMLEKMVSLL